MGAMTFRKSIGRFAQIALLMVLAACGDGGKTGPEDVHWDRDVCELCQMFISDARFVAEVRGGERRTLHKFDDIGCAINWLNKQEWAGDPTAEIWVASVTSTRESVVWLDARQARYVKGELTPMNYGYSAYPPSSTASGEAEGIGFVELTSKIIANGENHICKTLK